MISKLYNKIEKLALNKYNDIIIDSGIIFSYSGRARKLRLVLVDMSFIDIWYSDEGDYSFHWEQREIRNTIYRHDNALHKKWKNIRTFPKHCHDGLGDNATESHIPDDPEEATVYFLAIVKSKLKNYKQGLQ